MEKLLQNHYSSENLAEELFKRYYTRFCYFAYQLLKDEKVAEDIVQDAFVAFWRNRQLISENPVAIKNYFYSSIRNACYNIHRHAKVQARFQQIYQPEISEDPKLLESIIRAEIMDSIYDAIKLLPPSCCKIFRLGYLEGLSNPQIAEELGISINTVKTQKRRALIMLRTRLNPEVVTLVMAVITLGG